MRPDAKDIPYGYCHCGCGEKTNIAKTTKNRLNWSRIKGEPAQYIRGHNRLRSHVDYLEDANGCWIWQRKKSRYGYAMAVISGKEIKAHRYYYERVHGPVPKGLELDHLCRVRACVNHEHLEPVTREVNTQRGLASRLDPDKVKEIRSLYKKITITAMAKKFNVDGSTIHRVVTGKTWKNILAPVAKP